jgi:hypothetical protein
MALTEKQSSKIEIIKDGTVFVQTDTTVLRDGAEIATTVHRNSFVPGADVSSQPQQVQDVCAAAWTPEVVAAFKAKSEAAVSSM